MRSFHPSPAEYVLIAAFSWLCLASIPVTSGTGQSAAPGPPESRHKNNFVVEANDPKLARLTVEVRAPDLKEPLKYEIKASNGSAVGGIYVPPDDFREILVSAFDARGIETHRGSENQYIRAGVNSPLFIRLQPTEAGAPLMVALRSHRIQLEQLNTKGLTSRLRVRVFDPDGQPANLSPGDVKWGVTDPRQFQLIPVPDNKHAVALRDLTDIRPAGGGTRICNPFVEVLACYRDVICSTVVPCKDPWVSITAGGKHTCGLTQSGVAWCWGANLDGGLGASTSELCLGGIACSTRPVAVHCPPGTPCRFKRLAAGTWGTCGIDTNLDAWCWGQGTVFDGVGFGGLGKVQSSSAGTSLKFKEIAVGLDHACAISLPGIIWCWGDNHFGQLGLSRTIHAVQIRDARGIFVLSSFGQITAALNHNCAITDDGASMACWGSNRDGQVVGPNLIGPVQIDAACNCTNDLVWQSPPAGSRFDVVAAGESSTCAHFTTGETKCWGANVPNGLPPTMSATRLAVGLDYLCALINQAAICEGNGNSGQLGNGSNAPQPSPVSVSVPPSAYSDLVAGKAHTCGFTSSGQAFCWGANDLGQLGIGTASVSQSNVPLHVIGP